MSKLSLMIELDIDPDLLAALTGTPGLMAMAGRLLGAARPAATMPPAVPVADVARPPSAAEVMRKESLHTAAAPPPDSGASIRIDGAGARDWAKEQGRPDLTRLADINAFRVASGLAPFIFHLRKDQDEVDGDG